VADFSKLGIVRRKTFVVLGLVLLGLQGLSQHEDRTYAEKKKFYDVTDQHG